MDTIVTDVIAVLKTGSPDAYDATALLAAIDPDAYAAGTYTTSWVAAKHHYAMAALITAGDLGSGATLNAKLQQATDSSGTGVKDITGKYISALTQTGTDDNKQAWINVRPEELDVDSGFAFVRLSMTVATATSDAAAYLFGAPRSNNAADVDASTVDEIVG